MRASCWLMSRPILAPRLLFPNPRVILLESWDLPFPSSSSTAARTVTLHRWSVGRVNLHAGVAQRGSAALCPHQRRLLDDRHRPRPPDNVERETRLRIAERGEGRSAQ